jgi:alkylation response protein AidB-like acyl-CoA dehydrogenase
LEFIGKEILMQTTRNEIPYLATLEAIAVDVIRPAAVQVDEGGLFPRAAVNALSKGGLLGLISAAEVGGSGQGLRAAVMAVERVARECGSTAMVLCMHYAATAVIEAHGPRSVREDIAAGRHLTTLAFSESGSRSHFWAPVSTASSHNGTVRLDAKKGWVTSAGEADSYVWSSRPVEAEGASTLWLVPARTAGLSIPMPFNGLGLRGNASSPITAQEVMLQRAALLGPDGGGFDVMMSIVLPYFQLMNAAFSIGTMESATEKTCAHVAGAKLQHLGQSLSDLPTIRAYVARMRVKVDMTRALLFDALDAIETNRSMRCYVLETKAATGRFWGSDRSGHAVCGGAAFRKDVGVERHFRDARAATVMAPTTDVLYDFIGKAVCGMPLF